MSRRRIAAAFLLFLGAAGLYAPTVRFAFVNWDDGAYVTANPEVLRGLTGQGVVWAFTSGQTGNWHPVTWLSHMADTTLFGPGPAARHLVNILLHGVATGLLFLLLASWTGEAGRPALVAALFAVHPLHVESVAWISERKDLLCAVAGLAALGAWTAWTRRGSRAAYAAAVALFAIGLASKPMIVTLPFVMLLADAWPLRRLGVPPTGSEIRRRCIEKAPFFALAAASAIVTMFVQRGAGAMELGDRLPMADRFGNAAISVVLYAGQAVWPVGLAPFYPWPARVSLAAATGAAALVAAVTGIAVMNFRARPWLAVGWLWFLGMLVPVAGLVQVGLQSRADHYTYLPLAGLFIAAVWAIPFPVSRYARFAALGGCTAVVGLLAGTTLAQERLWKDGLALWTRGVACYPGDVTNRTNFAHALEMANRFDESVRAYEGAGWPERGAIVLVRLGRRGEAIGLLERAVAKGTPRAAVLRSLGTLLDEEGRGKEAVERLRQAVSLDPADAEARTNLSAACERLGLRDEALTQARAAVGLRPGLTAARFNLALVLQKSGRLDEAIGQYEDVLRETPSDASALHNLGVALHARGRTAEAIEQWRAALAIEPGRESTRRALAEALARPALR